MADKWPDRLPVIDARNRGRTDTVTRQDISWLLSEIRRLRRKLNATQTALQYERQSLWAKFKEHYGSK